MGVDDNSFVELIGIAVRKKIFSLIFPLMALVLLAGNSLTVTFCECLGQYFIMAQDCASTVAGDETSSTCCCPADPVEPESEPSRDCSQQFTLELEEFVTPDGRLFANAELDGDFTAPDSNCLSPLITFSPGPDALIAPRGSPPKSAPSLSKLCIRQV